MPLPEFLLTAAVMVPIGVVSGWLLIKLIERRNGEIKLREDLYRHRAKALGYDSDEVWIMGEMWATVGAHEYEAREAAKNYARGGQ